MRKTFVLVLLLSTVITPITSWGAAPKTGTVCAKLGSQVTYKAKVFTCVKSGKKKVWNSGAAQIAPVAVASPAPSASQTPTISPSVSPTTTPSAFPTPSSFNDLVKNYQGIPVAVWQEIRSRAAANSAPTRFEVQTGPKTSQPLFKPSVEPLLARASNIFSKFSQPSVTKVFYFNHDDVLWAQAEHGKLSNPKFRAQELADNCPNNSNCGAFGSASSGVGAMFMGIHKDGLDPLEIYGGTEIHEFTHVVQYANFSSAVFNNPNKYLPGWFIEGQASAVQQAGGTFDYAEYLLSRDKWFSHTPKSPIKSYSADEILNFFDLQGPGKYDQATWSHVYDIGSFATEALIAVGGLQSTFDLITYVSAGKSFEDAFEATYKISWNSAAPILAEAVAKQYKAVWK